MSLDIDRFYNLVIYWYTMDADDPDALEKWLRELHREPRTKEHEEWKKRRRQAETGDAGWSVREESNSFLQAQSQLAALVG